MIEAWSAVVECDRCGDDEEVTVQAGFLLIPAEGEVLAALGELGWCYDEHDRELRCPECSKANDTAEDFDDLEYGDEEDSELEPEEDG